MNGQKERLMVLDMIAEGKITAEEAEQLFKAMDAVDEESASASPELVPPLSHLSHLASLVSPLSPETPISPLSPEAPVTNNARTRDLLSALKDADIGHVTMSDLQEMKIHNLTADDVG